MTLLRVLVVDDDFRVAQLHAHYVEAADGFEVVGVEHTLQGALAHLAKVETDLILLDEYLPDGQGSQIIGTVDAAVIMVSAAEEPSVVRRAIACGAVNYILKPFKPMLLIDRLAAFRRFWKMLDFDGDVDQTGVDRALQALRTADSPVAVARKGRSPVTSKAIVEVLRTSQEALTAIEVADATGVSRATSQRYLSDLVRDGRAELTLRYGSTGRPEHCFEWVGRR